MESDRLAWAAAGLADGDEAGAPEAAVCEGRRVAGGGGLGGSGEGAGGMGFWLARAEEGV